MASATAAAAAAAAIGFSSFHASSSILSKSASFAPGRNLRTRFPLLAIRASSSSSSSSSSPTPPPAEFNITFGVAPKSVPSKPDNSPAAGPLVIPWIVRGEDGNLKLQSTPPAYLLQAMAHAKTTSTNKKKKEKTAPASASAELKHSKAARRFYNENFREPKRLSKVLAAAGGEYDARLSSVCRNASQVG